MDEEIFYRNQQIFSESDIERIDAILEFPDDAYLESILDNCELRLDIHNPDLNQGKGIQTKILKPKCQSTLRDF